jgi:aspartate kinase
MIVMKFDAASIGSHDRLRAVAQLVQQHKGKKPVVVTSALPKVTDLLLEAADLAAARQSDYEDRVQEVKALHEQVVEDLLPDGPGRRRFSNHLKDLLEELRVYYSAVYALAELTPRTRDAIAAIGERLSSELVAEALSQHGPARGDDRRAHRHPHRRQVRRGVTAHGRDRPAPEAEDEADAGHGPGARHRRLHGRDQRRGHHHPRPRGRGRDGGRDRRAARRRGDPDLGRGGRLHDRRPQARPDALAIPRVTPDEAAELTYFGSKVLHPAMIRPAVDKGIPVRIGDSREPALPGTVITATADLGPSGPCAVACRKGITVVLLSTPRMLMATGFLRQVFEVFERHDTPVDLIATSEVSISVTIDDVEHLAEIKADLARLGEVKILRENAIVSLIGRGFFRYQGLSRRIFEALADVNVGDDLVRGFGREHLRSGRGSRCRARGA